MKQSNYRFIKTLSETIESFFTWISSDVAEFIACQSALETNYGHSSICQENNNLFGMKLPEVRITNAIGSNRSHAMYMTVGDSVIDYFLWCSYYGMRKLYFLDLQNFISAFPWSKYCPREKYLSSIIIISQSFQIHKKNEQS